MPRPTAPFLLALFLALGSTQPLCLTASANSSSVASPAPTKPPQIYYVVARPICSELQRHIAPAIGMLLQNDVSISKSPPIFKEYIRNAFMTADPKSASDSSNNPSPGRDMALQHMEALVPRLAQNVIAVQKIVENTTLANPTGDAADDKRLQQIREELMKTLGLQSASLDLINGFVTTQQLGDIQHAGEEYLGALQGGGVEATAAPPPGPNALMQDPNQPGLPPNPYSFDVLAMPGLSVGYNPVSRIVDALQYIRGATTSRENQLASTVSSVAASCGVAPQASPTRHP
ncbi:MAG: hypothetical protein JOZ77_09610 [Candidatus Eremiobacteraeota bacterium]|nr:hypothetical protein [Candidatus Eremiobacteraeota bacterium]